MNIRSDNPESLVEPDKVRAVRAALPPAPAIEQLAEVFTVLSDPGRLRLLSTLLEAGELCVSDLAAAADLSPSATSHALRLLRAHRIVTVTRRQRMAYYRLEDSHVRMLLDLGFVHGDHTAAMRQVDTAEDDAEADTS